MRAILLLTAVTALAGCGPTIPDPQCGSTQGFIFGEVTAATVPVQVYALRADGDDLKIIEAEMSGGAYQLNLEGGLEYTVWAEDSDGCTSSDVVLQVEACTEYEEDLAIRLDDCVTADKPNLYLHQSQTPHSR